MGNLKKTIDLNRMLRPNIRGIVPYSSARSEFTGDARIFLDANENYRDYLGDPDHPRNRYPDPFQKRLKERVSEVYRQPAERIFLGNGSDEAIDLLFRAFAEPGSKSGAEERGVSNILSDPAAVPRGDFALILPPTYGVYQVFADVHDCAIVKVPLSESFGIDFDLLRTAVSCLPSERLKLLFLCSPNNPTGRTIAANSLEAILDLFPGMVVVDEAYQDFSRNPSALQLLDAWENLVVLRTLSKAWGLANVRLGMAFAAPPAARVLQNIKLPYNLSGPAQEEAMRVLAAADQVAAGIEEIRTAREDLAEALSSVSFVREVYPSEANFLLVRVTDADRFCVLLRERGIIIRNRNREPGCGGCVRITIGSGGENAGLLQAVREVEREGLL